MILKLKLDPKPFNIQTLNPKCGFTLVELLVVLAVFAVLSAVSIVGYRAFNERQKVQNSGQTLKNIVRDAQNRAYSGEIDCTICGCTTGRSGFLRGWRVDFGGRRIYGECSNGNIFGQKNFSDYQLAPEVTITQPNPNPTGVLFNPFPPSASNTVAACVWTSSLPNQYYGIAVRAGGTITDTTGIVNGTVCVSP